jgi:capsular exopolysaccharide synthesis family protein
LARGRVLSPARGPGSGGRWTEGAQFDEAIRILRSNLSVALADIERPTIVVTSANANEGKTLTSTNLAASFAAAGQRTILVDLDLRHPNAHYRLDAHNEYGVLEVLLGRMSLEDAIQYVEVGPAGRTPRPGLYFLGTGARVENPSEVLGGRRTARLLESLAKQADVVLLDTPPVLPVADTLVVGRMASGAILVAEARRTAVPAIQKAKDLLIRNQTRLLGIVLNKFQHRDAGLGYGYGYGLDREVNSVSRNGHEPYAISDERNVRSGSPTSANPGTGDL